MYTQGQGTADEGTGPPTSRSGAAPHLFRDLRDLCPQETGALEVLLRPCCLGQGSLNKSTQQIGRGEETIKVLETLWFVEARSQSGNSQLLRLRFADDNASGTWGKAATPATSVHAPQVISFFLGLVGTVRGPRPQRFPHANPQAYDVSVFPSTAKTTLQAFPGGAVDKSPPGNA